MRATSAKVVREVFVDRRMTRSIIRRCESRIEGKLHSRIHPQWPDHLYNSCPIVLASALKSDADISLQQRARAMSTAMRTKMLESESDAWERCQNGEKSQCERGSDVVLVHRSRLA